MNAGLCYILIVFSTLCIWNSQALPQSDVGVASNDQSANTYSKELQNGILSFGNNLLKVLHKEVGAPEENTLISPINVYTALFMAYIGSAGKTKNEMATVMGFKNPDEQNHNAVVSDSLSTIIKKLEFKPSDSWGTFTEESMANGLFVQKDFPLNEKYTNLVNQYFSAQISNLDFAAQPKEATNFINNWVSEKTKGRIAKLYQDPIDQSTVAVIASALYFSGQWDNQFYSSKTKTEKFNTGTKEVDVQMMNDVQRVPYISNSTLKFEAIKLPYGGREFELVIVLPDVSQNVHTLVQSLKDEDLNALLKDQGQEGYSQGVDYKIPKMKFSFSKSLKDPLHKQGIKSLFEAADLSQLTAASAALRISDVDHATEIEIDEEGTRASAVTAIKIVPYSLQIPPRKPKQFICNRAFLMFLYNRPTETVSFSAVVHQPTA